MWRVGFEVEVGVEVEDWQARQVGKNCNVISYRQKLSSRPHVSPVSGYSRIR